MTSAFDPRVTPVRPDLAARRFEGQVQSARFVDGVVREVVDAQAPLRETPAPDAQLATEALLGERVTVYESTDEGWAWGQLASDGYVGFLPANALSAPGPAPTHKVKAVRTFLFPGPSIKLPPVSAPSMGSCLAVARIDGPFAVTASGAFAPSSHLAPVDWFETDFVAVAERFLGVPYLWGGKSGLGLDCSGLVQVSLTACGIACPRDTDMQERSVGAAVELSDLQRGDLVFWKGHVAIARDKATLLHANAFHMSVTMEPTAAALARIRANGSEVTSVRRPRPQ